MSTLMIGMRRLIRHLGDAIHWPYIRDFLRHYIGGLYERADQHHIFLLAGGLAFSLFVCIIPLMLIVFWVLGRLLSTPHIATEIDALIDRSIPYTEYANFVKSLILGRVREFNIFGGFTGIIGIVGLFFAATGLFSSMRTVLNKVYHVKDQGSVLIGKLRDVGLLVMVLLYFLLATAILPAWDVTQKIADRVAMFEIFRFNWVQNFALEAISFIIVLVAFFIIYSAVPHRKPSKQVVFVSATGAAVLWEIAKQLFGYYITHFVTIKEVYGAYSLVVVVAFWIYYSALVFIVGAEIGQLFRERLKRHHRPNLPGPADYTFFRS